MLAIHFLNNFSTFQCCLLQLTVYICLYLLIFLFGIGPQPLLQIDRHTYYTRQIISCIITRPLNAHHRRTHTFKYFTHIHQDSCFTCLLNKIILHQTIKAIPCSFGNSIAYTLNFSSGPFSLINLKFYKRAFPPLIRKLHIANYNQLILKFSSIIH